MIQRHLQHLRLVAVDVDVDLRGSGLENVVKTSLMPGVWFAVLMKSLATFSNCGGCEVGAVLQTHGEAGLSAHSAHGRRDEHGRLRFFDLVEARGDRLRNAIDGEAFCRPLARVVDDGKDRPRRCWSWSRSIPSVPSRWRCGRRPAPRAPSHWLAAPPRRCAIAKRRAATAARR